MSVNSPKEYFSRGSLLVGMGITVIFCTVIIFLVFYVVPNVYPVYGIKYSPILSIYLESTNTLAGHNVEAVYGSNKELTRLWLAQAQSRFGSIEDGLNDFAMKGDSLDSSEKMMAIYFLRCLGTDKAKEYISRIIAKSNTKKDLGSVSPSSDQHVK